MASSSTGPAQPAVQTQQPPGRVIHQKRRFKELFNTWTVPDVPKDAIIVAAAAPTLVLADPSEDGWMLSDMYAFNYLLRSVSTDQTWLAVNTEEKLLETHGDYLHGNPFKPRKIVLSRELLEADAITRVETVTPSQMITIFLDRVHRACRVAKSKNQPVILFLFAHGDSRHDIFLNAENDEKGLDVSELIKVIDPEVQLTMITNACFSGGWAVSRNINSTVLAAASPQDPSLSWQLSDSIGRRACGSVFSSSIIRSLVKLSESSTDEDDSLSIELSHLQLDGPRTDLPEPTDPKEVETLNSFVHVLNETLRVEISACRGHEFHFSAQDDEWEQSWTKRTGIPLSNFESRWSQLRDFLGDQYESRRRGERSYTDQDPDNPDYSDPRKKNSGNLSGSGSPLKNPSGSSSGKWPAEVSGGNFSNKARGNEIRAAGEIATHTGLTVGARKFDLPPGGIRRLKKQAEAYLKICPGDSAMGWEVGLQGRLHKFVDKPNPSQVFEIFQTLHFREATMNYVNRILDAFQIPPAFNGTCCQDWHYLAWVNGASRHGEAKQRYNMLLQELYSRECHFVPSKVHGQGPMFTRPERYIAACLVNAGMNKDDTFHKLDLIIQAMQWSLRAAVVDTLKHKEVREARENWRSLRRGTRKV